MKLGISKIEYIDSRSIMDFGTVAPGSSIRLDDFIQDGAAFASLPFTFNTADIDEQWTVSKSGKMSEVSVSASLRAERERYRKILQQLVGRKCVFKVTRVSGERYIIGSRQYVPTFSFSEKISGISSSEYSLSIRNASKHGILFDVD